MGNRSLPMGKGSERSARELTKARGQGSFGAERPPKQNRKKKKKTKRHARKIRRSAESGAQEIGKSKIKWQGLRREESEKEQERKQRKKKERSKATTTGKTQKPNENRIPTRQGPY